MNTTTIGILTNVNWSQDSRDQRKWLIQSSKKHRSFKPWMVERNNLELVQIRHPEVQALSVFHRTNYRYDVSFLAGLSTTFKSKNKLHPGIGLALKDMTDQACAIPSQDKIPTNLVICCQLVASNLRAGGNQTLLLWKVLVAQPQVIVQERRARQRDNESSEPVK